MPTTLWSICRPTVIPANIPPAILLTITLCAQVQSNCLNTGMLLVLHFCTFLYWVLTVIVDVALGERLSYFVTRVQLPCTPASNTTCWQT